jgi:hypothetical protein
MSLKKPQISKNIFKMPRFLKEKPRILIKDPSGNCRIATMISLLLAQTRVDQ